MIFWPRLPQPARRDPDDLLPRPESHARVKELDGLMLRWSERVNDPVAAHLAKKYA